MVARVLLVLFLLALGTRAQLDRRPTGRRARGPGPKLAMGRERAAHLHFFFHDTVSGKNPTAARVVTPPDAASRTMFGAVMVMDDPLTEGPEPGSRPVGRAQGFYMSSAQTEVGFLQAMNLVLTDGPYNGSVATVLGRNCPLERLREMPVVGGTGAFRFARGYALARTHSLDLKTGDAVVEYDVHLIH